MLAQNGGRRNSKGGSGVLDQDAIKAEHYKRRVEEQEQEIASLRVNICADDASNIQRSIYMHALQRFLRS